MKVITSISDHDMTQQNFIVLFNFSTGFIHGLEDWVIHLWVYFYWDFYYGT